MAINETLKFSWGHIITFIVLIFISYASFMGLVYLYDGDFLCAGLGVLVVNLVLILFFIIPQILKGTDKKFRRKIIVERILILLSPLFFTIAMVPFIHFGTVFKNRLQIETIFSKSIKASKEMFAAYEDYANNRIKNYDMKLAENNTNTVSHSNKIEALKLQIIADNYNALKKSAVKWVDNAAGATVWNVFMLGNIKKIENAIENWNNILHTFSSKIMTDEPESVHSFSSEELSVIRAKGNLTNLRSVYTTWSGPTALTIGIGILLYILLLFPYFIQSRNTKNTFRLFGTENKAFVLIKNKNKMNHSDDDTTYHEKDITSLNNGDYETFTM